MQIAELPINMPQNLNTDSSVLSVANETMINGIYDFLPEEQRFVSRYRAGLASWVSLGTSAKIDGLFEWVSKGWVIAVSGGSVFKIIDDIGTFVDITGAGTMTAGTRPTFAVVDNSGTEYLFIASGGQIAYTDGTTATQYIADANAPTNCTHIGTIDQYLLANDTQNDNLYYSAVGDPFTWSSLSFVSAEASVDKITALHVIGRSVVLFGNISIEPFWSTGGTPPFERRSDAIINRGTNSPYSIAEYDGTVYMLDHRRKVVAIRGAQIQEVSRQVDTAISALESVSDARGVISAVDGKLFYEIKFPTDDRTFCYSIDHNYWTEKKSWNSTLSEDKEYIGTETLHATTWGFHLVGDTTTENIYKASYTTYQDNGTLFRFFKRTGHSHLGGPVQRKQCRRVMFDAKMGVAARGGTAYLVVRQNIDRMGFGSEQFIDLMDLGETGPPQTVFGRGIFRTIQYEFSYTENTPFFLIAGYIEFESLDW